LGLVIAVVALPRLADSLAHSGGIDVPVVLAHLSNYYATGHDFHPVRIHVTTLSQHWETSLYGLQNVDQQQHATVVIYVICERRAHSFRLVVAGTLCVLCAKIKKWTAVAWSTGQCRHHQLLLG
jgi:hypothetical protein